MTPAARPKKTAKARPAPRRSSAPKKRPPAKPAPKKTAKAPPRPAPKAPAKPAAKGGARPAKKAEAAAPGPTTPPRTGEARRHLLSLSFLRDGDEFLARLETDGGQITELKNRALDQLLTLVAGELEDLLE